MEFYASQEEDVNRSLIREWGGQAISMHFQIRLFQKFLSKYSLTVPEQWDGAPYC